MEDDTLSTGELAERRGYTGRNGQGGEPDVLLDVPQLGVEEILLDVEDLRAHLSVQSDVLNLLRLSVGADVQLGGLHLEIRGLKAQALLKVRLDTVADMINTVLSTIDRNPEIVDQVVAALGSSVSEGVVSVGSSVDEAVGAVGSSVDEAVGAVGSSVNEAVGAVGERSP